MNRPVVPSISPPRMSIEAFEAWAERQDGRYELVRGHPVMMNQTTWNHSYITTNLVMVLGNALDHDLYHVAIGDFGLQTGEDTIRLADIMVTPNNKSGKDRRTEEAVLLIEILSPSTANDDFGDKQREYLALSSLQAYLIVAQDKVCAWLWLRGEDGFPEKPEVIEDLDATLTIAALDITLTLRAIYRGVAF
jgi:Uma2 family endonuclease